MEAEALYKRFFLGNESIGKGTQGTIIKAVT